MKRRDFLGSAPCAALGSLGITNTLLNLRMITNATAAPAGPGDYRALVCLFLNGGNDSYNMLVPTGATEYANYAAIRSNLALPAPGSGGTDALLPLSATNTGGRTFGVHGAMPELQSLFNNGNASFIANVGSLVEPMTVAQYDSGSRTKPRSLFSHNDQRLIWQTSIADSTSKTGWAGRMADKVMANNTSNAVSMNISLDGNKLFLTGESNFAYAISKDGATLLDGATSGNSANQARVAAAKSIVEETQRNILMRAFAEEKSRSYSTAEQFAAAFNATSLTTSFGSSSLAGKLKAVARTIAARDTIGHKRQVFFVEMTGFDNHDELLNNQSALLSTIDAALKEFWDATVELGVENEVTLFSASDFARTIRSNGLGTDHAWGGNSFVMGGAVDGSKIFGDYPTDSDLQLGAGLDVGFNGRYLPTTSVDRYFAELALWFGLPQGDLDEVFPNIGNFGTYSAASPPIGFLL